MRSRILALLACMLLVGAGCGGDGEPTETAAPPPNPVTGVVTEMDSAGLDSVQGFALQADGETYEFVVDPAVEYGFPLSHLRSHMVDAAPVIVEYEDRDGTYYALSIEDA